MTDFVDTERIPHRTLYTGSEMPGIGFGTFGSDASSGEEVALSVSGAMRAGYRYIDCAACYGNEHLIGEVIRNNVNADILREELFVLSKLWNDKHKPSDVAAACRKTLMDLKLEYLDCYLVHWPFPNYHPPGCGADIRNPDSRPYIHEEFMDTWRAMERLVNEGLVRHIGTSNVTIPKLRLILRDAGIKPAVNQMELHPCFQQGELYQFCVDHEIQPIGYSPIGSPKRPERDRTPDDIADIEHPVIIEIAKRHDIHPALICLKWASQRGQIPIPFSTKKENYIANLRCVTEDPLTIDEMENIKSVERNCRLIKGQVFLWSGAKSWLDLWDIDGTIPGWTGYTRDGGYAHEQNNDGSNTPRQ
ncbi:MAG: aldo/keto reductase [Oscillospiraceae bacterium]|nr:aldo/keto reductase [Oscillospiraceae bacterium]